MPNLSNNLVNLGDISPRGLYFLVPTWSGCSLRHLISSHPLSLTCYFSHSLLWWVSFFSGFHIFLLLISYPEMSLLKLETFERFLRVHLARKYFSLRIVSLHGLLVVNAPVEWTQAIFSLSSVCDLVSLNLLFIPGIWNAMMACVGGSCWISYSTDLIIQ